MTHSIVVLNSELPLIIDFGCRYSFRVEIILIFAMLTCDQTDI